MGEQIEFLFSEELGAVLQIKESDFEAACKLFPFEKIGKLTNDFCLTINNSQLSTPGSQLYKKPISELRKLWSRTSFEIAKLRDNPDCAEQEYDWKCSEKDKGINITFNSQLSTLNSQLSLNSQLKRPLIAILREQGVNGEVEMAAAFDKAGFKAVDVHTGDIINGKMDLSEFSGLVACGGFSYGDVLGAGEGWAKSILFNERARDVFQKFFERKDTFSLGVCNGCQMLSNLKDIIPGAAHGPSSSKIYLNV